MENNIQSIKDFLNSEEGKQSMKDYFEKLELEEQHQIRWADRMYERIKGNVDESIERILNWYDSPRYREREYKMSYEPREPLLWVLVDVAEKYGRPATEEEWDTYGNIFTGVIYILGSYTIQIMHGQGSVIRIDKYEK